MLVTYERLERKKYLDGQELDDFLGHLRDGIGDCTDYSYAAVNNFYALCDLLGRKDIKPRVKIVFGFHVKDRKLDSWHNWIKFYLDGKWIDVEVAWGDKISKDESVNLETQAMYSAVEDSKNFNVPVMTSVMKDGIKHYLNVK